MFANIKGISLILDETLLSLAKLIQKRFVSIHIQSRAQVECASLGNSFDAVLAISVESRRTVKTGYLNETHSITFRSRQVSANTLSDTEINLG